MRYFRLLPAVIVLGLTLLALKGAGIVREAQAQGAPQLVADASANDAIAQPKDVASDDAETSSAAEVDVLSSLSKRRAELDTRARAQDMRENVLAATEKRVDAKITALKALQTQISTLLGQRDAAQEKQVASLVKTYSSMKPKDAARIFDGLSEDVLIPVAQEMKSDALAPVLAAMNPSAAQKLTVKLASKLSLPETAAGAAPPPAIPPAPLQTQASATSAPATATPQTTAPQPLAPQPAAQQPAPAPQAAAPQTAPSTGKHG